MTPAECLVLYEKIYTACKEPQCDAETGVELYNAVLKSPPGDVIEIGSAFGGSTVWLVGAAQEVGKGVISIDPYPESDYVYASVTPIWKKFFKNNFLDYYDNIIQHNCDMTECVELLPDTISVGFIDGCHDNKHADREFVALTDRLCHDGRLILDDTHLESLSLVAAKICEPQFDCIKTVGKTRAKFGRFKKELGDSIV